MRLRILDCAGEMFLAQGYGAVSMDALAEAVPVSKRTLYNHFRDKKSLFTAVMQNRCQTVFYDLRASLRNTAPRAALERFAVRFLDVVYSEDAVNMYRIAITQSQPFPDLGRLFYESGPKRSLAILADCLERWDRAGALEAPKPKRAADAFLSMLAGRTQMRCLLGLKTRVGTAEKRTIVAYVLDTFLRAHAPKR